MQNKKEDYIVIISAVPFPYGNASDNAIYTFMDGFQEHGCKGEVVCLFPNMPKAHSGEPAIGEYNGVKYRFLHGKVSRSSNKLLSVIDNRILSKYYIKKYLRNISSQYQVTAIFITHTDEFYADIFGYCRDLGVRVVLTTCEYPEYLAKDYDTKLQKYRLLSNNIDKYIFETKTLQDYEQKALGHEIDSIVVPATMPFDDIISCQKDQSVKAYMAYSGSIHSESKDGLKNIIKAFSVFHESFPHIGFKFIGRISNLAYFEELQELVRTLNLQDAISFTGEVDRKEYVKEMVNAQLMVVAKPKDSYYGGGLSSKVIEYLFSGNPVVMVASDDYVNYLTHKENVYFTEDNTPEKLSAAMLDVFSDDSLRSKIALGGKQFAMTHFNYHILTKDLLAFVLR